MFDSCAQGEEGIKHVGSFIGLGKSYRFSTAIPKSTFHSQATLTENVFNCCDYFVCALCVQVKMWDCG